MIKLTQPDDLHKLTLNIHLLYNVAHKLINLINIKKHCISTLIIE